MLLDQVLDRVKRKWLKLVKVERKSLYTLEQKDMDIIIQELQGKAFEQDTNVQQPNQNLTARYWACKKLWAGKGGSTKSSPKNRQGKY